MTQIGFVFHADDNDSYMFAETSARPKGFGYKCNYDLNVINPKYVLPAKSRKYDVSYTFDAFLIVSEEFKSFVLREGYQNLEFVPLPSTKGFFWFKVNNIVEFDAVKRETRFINFNSEFDSYEEVVGATPVFLKDPGELSRDGFFRTDISFGGLIGKDPLIVIGRETKRKLSSKKFKGLIFSSIQV